MTENYKKVRKQLNFQIDKKKQKEEREQPGPFIRSNQRNKSYLSAYHNKVKDLGSTSKSMNRKSSVNVLANKAFRLKSVPSG